MLKGVYLYSKTIDSVNMLGVINKISSQVSTFNNYNLECSLYYFFTIKNFKVRNNCSMKKKFNIKDAKVANYDYFYIRKPGVIDFIFINMIRKIKQLNNNCKIILEIPTYPYDYELKKNVVDLIKLYIDKVFRMFLVKYVDRIATLTSDKTIFGVETLRIDNGIDFNNYKVRDFKQTKNDTINLCAIARFDFWHGYERLLYGLSKYYTKNDRKVILHMVGDGPELEKYMNIVNDLHLDQFVKFYGILKNEELRNIYNICDASVGSLCDYKKNIYDTFELKSTESLAFGIPFISGCKSSRLINKGYKYFLELPNNYSDISINSIIDFIDKLYIREDPLTITKNIRKFGEKYFSMDSCMKSVIDYIKS